MTYYKAISNITPLRTHKRWPPPYII